MKMKRRTLLTALFLTLSSLIFIGLLAAGGFAISWDETREPVYPSTSSPAPEPKPPKIRPLVGMYLRDFKNKIRQGEKVEFQLVVTDGGLYPSESLELSPLVLICKVEDFPFGLINLSSARAKGGDSLLLEARTGPTDESMMRLEIRPSPRFTLHHKEERVFNATLLVGKDVRPGRYRIEVVAYEGLRGGGILIMAHEFNVVSGG